MTPKRDSRWRDEASGLLLVKHLRRLSPAGRALIMGDPRDEVAEAMTADGLKVDRWWRRAFAGRAATAWPPTGPFDVIAMRLPRAKDELSMTVHAAATALKSDGRLCVYGAKDEGIGSAASRLEEVFIHVRTLATGGHCRVLTAHGVDADVSPRASLTDWRVESLLSVAGTKQMWISYPGVFAQGKVDDGTAMLIRNLPAVPRGGRVLDFGCGSGMVAAAISARDASITVDCLDVDTVALQAVAENLPEANRMLGDGIDVVADRTYQAIVSNPPYHRGKAESLGVVEGLIDGASRLLEDGGRLVFVVQRRLPVEPLLEHAFQHVRTLEQDGTYRVWLATKGTISGNPPR